MFSSGNICTLKNFSVIKYIKTSCLWGFGLNKQFKFSTRAVLNNCFLLFWDFLNQKTDDEPRN